jgi:hypothetical protein
MTSLCPVSQLPVRLPRVPQSIAPTPLLPWSTADLSGSLGDHVGHRDHLIGLLIQHQVIVTKVSHRHVPMEVLRLQIKRENIRE